MDVALLRPSPRSLPVVIGICGHVGVGKSRLAEDLKESLLDAGSTSVDVVSTDGFLYSTPDLESRRILHRKGFPESYDWRSLLGFLEKVKRGEPSTAPIYSHELYDLVPGKSVDVCSPQILILEGLNVLQQAAGKLPRRQILLTSVSISMPPSIF